MQSRAKREGRDPSRKRPLRFAHPNEQNRAFRKNWMRNYGVGPARRMTWKEILAAEPYGE